MADEPIPSEHDGASERDEKFSDAQGDVAEGYTDSTAFLVANNPLPENSFPTNKPSPERANLVLKSHPKVLDSVSQLQKLFEESQSRFKHSNYSVINTPITSARQPVFPTFTRFSSTRFANAESATYAIRKSDRDDCDALFDLEYPIVLSVTDGHNIPIPGLPVEGVLDSMGYPLLYSSENPRKLIRARSSGAMFPLNISRVAATRLSSSTVPDPSMIRTWSNMFTLTNDRDAQAILQQRVLGHSAGDNHIALLVKAYLAYLDSAAGALEGVELRRNAFSATGVVVNISTQEAWTASMLASPAEIVNVLGGSAGYQEFWAYCCFPQPPVYAACNEDGVVATTLFSHYKMGPGLATICLCDFEAYSSSRPPAFFGKPNLILGYIDTYVQKFGLQQQANEALQIAMLWPTLHLLKVHISLPKANHAADWLGGEVEPSSVKTSYADLVSSSPFVVLASTLAGACAMRSQIYDLVTLLSSKRHTWVPSKETIQVCATWLASHLSAPGVGWDFLLGHQFHTTSSFLYLTGLSVEVVNWPVLLSTFKWTEEQFPAHLRLLQAFWVKTSVCCQLPWENVWHPKLEFSGPTITASASTLMRMIRLGLLASRDGKEMANIPPGGIYPILDRDGEESVSIRYLNVEQLRIVKTSGVRVLALCAPPPRPEAQYVVETLDPPDIGDARAQWSLGALLRSLIMGT